MYTISLLVFLAFVVILLHRRFRPHHNRGSLPLPPGPKGLPLIGNLWDIPAEYPWLTYAKWSASYGDVIYLDTPGSPTIVLNSAQATTELLEKRSGNYSDRPDMHMLFLAGWNFSFAFMRYSDWWRLHRRVFHQYFQPRALPSYYPVQLKATSVLLRQLLQSSDNFFQHVRHHAGSIIMKTVYGYDVEPDDDPFVNLVDQAMTSIRLSLTYGVFLVDLLPILKNIPDWFPGAKFKKLARRWRKNVEDMREEPFRYTAESVAKGTASPSFVSENLKNMKQNGASESETYLEVLKNASGVAFGAGADTTVSTVLSAILAFVLYPEVLAKAQAELDDVVGQCRLPNFDDRPRLPYIDAILTEALRWNPVVPMGVAHRSMKDDIYKGYFIPGGATVIGNTWAILHDEKEYPNPLVFNPDRFMKKDGQQLPPDSTIAFGFGRRICPGRHLASNTAWIAIASIASTLSLSKAVDSDGHVIEPSDTFTGESLSFPLPFKCVFKARSTQAQALIDPERC
ncbi:cytochrome P450 [Desarmillaria tabescens]|uniref:Cytochrome P450 n=1 Tax=Armillaria tabescens TaxID=1929756 RepID=A0AA39NPP8_ARMTA|nr:cytochrome P450 [Desarmillaria tabescens]KAK0469518.1 cytochrome P450 [Desarmillaria tabescens]